MQAFESTGFWWLPGNEGKQVAGTLRVASDGDLHLSLIGRLGQQEVGVQEKQHRIILGLVDQSPCGNVVTLTGCIPAGFRMGGLHFYVREKYHASRAYFGAHLVTEADFTFRSMMVKFGGLTEWAHPISGLQRVPLPTKEGETVPIAKYHYHPRPIGRVSGASVTLNMGISSESDSQKFTFREEANLVIDLDSPRSADELNGQYVAPLQNLMTFVCDQPQKLEQFSVWPATGHTNRETNPAIRVIGQRVQPEGEDDEKKQISHHRMLFTLGEIDFEDFIGKWLDLSQKYSDAFSIIFGIQYGPPAYIDMTFALVAQSLTLYYTRTQEGTEHCREEERRLRGLLPTLPKPDAEWLVDQLGVRPYPPFQSVLRRLVSQHSDVMDRLLSKRQDAFINQTTNTLHYLERGGSDEKAAASFGADLYWMMQKLRFLLKACFLRELGFASDKVSELLQRNALYKHICMLEGHGESNRSLPNSASTPDPLS
jgi:hypothetical protein